MRESERRFRLIFENMTTGFALLEMLHDEHENPVDCRFLDANKAFELLSGRSVESILGRTILEVLPEEGRRWIETCDQVARTGVPTMFEAHASTLDKWFEVRVFRTACNQLGATVSDITERKRAEALLRQEYESCADLVNSQPAGMYLLRVFPKERWQKDAWDNPASAPYSLELVSDHFCEMLGIDRQIFAANPGIVMDMVHPDDKAECARRNKDANARLVPFRWEGRLIARGRTLWVHFESLPRPVANGDVLWMGILYDISELKRAEEALRESESKYRLLIDNASESIVVVQDGLLKFVNRITLDLLGGYSEQELINRPFPEFIHPDDRSMVVENYRRRMARDAEQLPQYAFRVVTRDGIAKWVEITATLIEWQGKPATLNFLPEITDRKQVEERLRMSEFDLRQAQATAHVGSWRWDVAHDEFVGSDEMYRIFGLPLHAFTGSLQDVIERAIHPDDRAHAEESARAAIEGHNSGAIEYRIIRPDGSIRTVLHETGEMTLDDKGNVSSLRGIVLDITERKRAEAQLRQSQKLEAVGQLAGGVAHDFNNLLTGILGNIALVRSSLPPADPLLENLNAAETAARQAATLTKGLLTFSHSAVVVPVPMKITDAIDTTLALLKQSLPATLQMARDDEQTAWNVLLDQSQMTQILLNLAVNARDAMEGKGTLTIRTRNEVVGEEYLQSHPLARAGEFVHLSVTDTGSGMPAEVMQNLFEPFYTTKPVGSGTGLGLSIVYGAVKQAGGWIAAVSTEGAGTTFDIYLPRCLEEPKDSLTPNPTLMHAAGETVLVVEDEPIVCAVAQALLSRSGYTVLTALEGASALSILHEHPADIELILLDMTMPGMTTNEIVHAVRILNPAIPILLTSGNTSSDAVNRMLDEGSVQGFLGKPYTLAELADKVQELLHRS